MPLDISRERFGPLRDFVGVLTQQGRVLLDSETNEQVRLVDRRFRATAMDTFAVPRFRAACPATGPDGFRIALVGGEILIGRGRVYVDGILVECHGDEAAAAPVEFDPRLAELGPSDPVRRAAQPHHPAPGDLPARPYLVYLDVWQREVGHLEQPDLVEPALALDTTGRLQTTWQVRTLGPLPADFTAATPDDATPGWAELVQPSAGRLSTHADAPPSDDSPCVLPAAGGYHGLDHRTYRVEIHAGGGLGAATFKWARHNATVGSAVTRIAGSTLTLDRLGRDGELSFHDGDWVEITDDHRELAGGPGVLRRITVKPAEVAIELDAPLDPALFGADDAAVAARHTRVRRWDQKGKVRDGAGAVIHDLDAAGSTGAIPVPTAAETRIRLEDGVEISFSAEFAGGAFRAGDHWVFTARTSTPTAPPSVETLVRAAPRGIHHHYARLAVVDAAGNVGDCRTPWPPGGAAGCECTECVEAPEHNSGTRTIQQAIETVIAAGGGTVCLAPGEFKIGSAPLRVAGARGLVLRGHGIATRLVADSGAPALVIEEQTAALRIERLNVVAPGGAEKTPATIVVRNSADVAFRDCVLQQVDADGKGPPLIGFAGVLLGVEIADCLLLGNAAVSNMLAGERGAGGAPLLTVGLRIVGNAIGCARAGVELLSSCIHGGSTTIAENLVLGAGDAAIALRGTTATGDGVDVRANRIASFGDGIVCSLDGATIAGNRLSGAMAADRAAVRLPENPARDRIDRCTLEDNSIASIGGDAIAIDGAVETATIRGNVLQEIGGLGVVMTEDAEGGSVVVEGNLLQRIGIATGGVRQARVAIRLSDVAVATVRSNRIIGVACGPGGEKILDEEFYGVQLIGCRHGVVAGNEITRLGPDEAFGSAAVAVDAIASEATIAVEHNVLLRDRAAADGDWMAVRIDTPQPSATEPIRVIAVGDLRVVGFDRAKIVPATPATPATPAVAAKTRFSIVAGARRTKVRPADAPVRAAVHGNRVVARGGRILIGVDDVHTATFDANQIVADGGGMAAAVSVRVRSCAAIVGNVVDVGEADARAMMISARPGKELSASILGNVTNRPIFVLKGDPPAMAILADADVKPNVRF